MGGAKIMHVIPSFCNYKCEYLRLTYGMYGPTMCFCKHPKAKKKMIECPKKLNGEPNNDG